MNFYSNNDLKLKTSGYRGKLVKLDSMDVLQEERENKLLAGNQKVELQSASLEIWILVI